MPVYELVVAKGGPKIKRSSDVPEAGLTIHQRSATSAELVAHGFTLDRFAGAPLGLDMPVLNKTNLPGQYDFSVTWPRRPGPLPAGFTGDPQPAFSHAMEHQLGLKLVRALSPVEVVVIDSIRRPPTD